MNMFLEDFRLIIIKMQRISNPTKLSRWKKNLKEEVFFKDISHGILLVRKRKKRKSHTKVMIVNILILLLLKIPNLLLIPRIMSLHLIHPNQNLKKKQAT